MGKEEYLKDVMEFARKSPVVDARSLSQIVKDKKRVKQYDKQLINNLLLDGRLKRLSKGFYTTHDDPSLAVLCFKPAYLGLQDALAFHGMTEQETISVIVTSRRVRPGIRKVMGANVLVRRLDKKYMFGLGSCKVGELYLPYSDPEKTLIDMVYFKEDVSGVDAGSLDRKVLGGYLKAYPLRIRKRVISLF